MECLGFEEELKSDAWNMREPEKRAWGFWGRQAGFWAG